MIQNIEKYGTDNGISRQDALQVFMQVVALKNLLTRDAALIGGTALVMGHGNPRFSEDIDLTGVEDPLSLKAGLTGATQDIGGLLGAKTALLPPKAGRTTWRLRCEMESGSSVHLHVDTQNYRALTQHPIMVAYPGMPPFVFPSITLGEIMADKVIALAFRNYASGRDIFDLWFHWLKDDSSSETDATILGMVKKKLAARKLVQKDFAEKLHARMSHGIPKRVLDEWQRYLPPSLQQVAFYKTIFDRVSEKIATLRL